MPPRVQYSAAHTWKKNFDTSISPMVHAPVNDATSAMTVAYAAVEGYRRRIWPFHTNPNSYGVAARTQ